MLRVNSAEGLTDIRAPCYCENVILQSLELGPFVENCYVIGDEKSREAAVIDPGDEPDTILLTLGKESLTAKIILLTHAHLDHVGGLKALKESTRADVMMHKADAFLLKTAPMQALAFGVRPFLSPSPDRFIAEGDTLRVGSLRLEVIHTPGHTPGGVCYCLREEKKVFVGDTLFAGSVGRTDLPGGDYEALVRSIREKLLPLGDDVEVLCGHGPPTTIGQERRCNPFLNEL